MKDNKLEIVHKSEGDVKPKESPAEKNLYKVLKKIPYPKKEMNLTPDQRKLWMFIGKELVLSNQISNLDIYHLQSVVIAIDIRNKLYKIINDKNSLDISKLPGSVQEFKNKVRQVSPEEVLVTRHTKTINDFSELFGLSIKDRQKLEPSEKDSNQMNWMEEFFGDSKPVKAN